MVDAGPAILSPADGMERGATYEQTLSLHRQHKTAEEIAAIRGLALGTIKSHLARLIESGQVEVHELLPAATVDAVIAFLQEHGEATLTMIRTGTGERFDYNDIRIIVAHWSRARARGGPEGR